MCYNQQGLTKLVLKRLYAAVSIKCLVQRFSGYLWDPAFFYTKASFLKFVFVFPRLISCPSFPVICKFGFGEFLSFFINKIKKKQNTCEKKIYFIWNIWCFIHHNWKKCCILCIYCTIVESLIKSCILTKSDFFFVTSFLCVRMQRWI